MHKKYVCIPHARAKLRPHHSKSADMCSLMKNQSQNTTRLNSDRMNPGPRQVGTSGQELSGWDLVDGPRADMAS